MKKLFFAAIVALLFASCTQEKNTESGDDPYRPIKGLQIPREVVAGQNLTLLGRGFAVDCALALSLNGTSVTFEPKVVSVDQESLVVAIPESVTMGFYAISLAQNGALTKIGGVNVRIDNFNENDLELHAISGTKFEIFPLSVSNQVISANPLPNSSAIADGYGGFTAASADGKLYYAGFDVGSGGKMIFTMGCYDSKTGENTAPVSVPNFRGMGDVDGKFCVMTTIDHKIYTLNEWNKGTMIKVRDFDLSALGGAPLLISDWRLIFHSSTRTLLLYGNMGVGDSMSQVTISLDMATGAVDRNGGSSLYKYWPVSVGDVLYCFAVKPSEDPSITAEFTNVYRVDNPQKWNISGSGATLVTTIDGTAFESPAYSPKTKKIYGLDDYDTFGAIITFDPAIGRFEGRRWVGPNVAGLFFLSAK